MEGLFAFLPALFILIIVGSRIYEAFKKLNTEQRRRNNDFSENPAKTTKDKAPYDNTDQEGLENVRESNKMETNTDEEYISTNFNVDFNSEIDTSIDEAGTDEENHENNDGEETQINEKNEKSHREKKKQKLSSEVEKNGYDKDRDRDIFGEKLTKNDLLKGIIFKEILDKPRAKRPYKFSGWK